MTNVRVLPTDGEVFLDERGAERVLRVSWHHENGLVVLSLWRAGACLSSFRLPVEEVPALIEVLSRGLGASYDALRTARAAG